MSQLRRYDDRVELAIRRVCLWILFIYLVYNLLMQALKILDDEVQCDIIKIASFVRNRVRARLNQYVEIDHRNIC